MMIHKAFQELVEDQIKWIRTRRSRDIDHEIADSLEKLLAENEALIEVLHQNGIVVDLSAVCEKVYD